MTKGKTPTLAEGPWAHPTGAMNVSKNNRIHNFLMNWVPLAIPLSFASYASSCDAAVSDGHLPDHRL